MKRKKKKTVVDQHPPQVTVKTNRERNFISRNDHLKSNDFAKSKRSQWTRVNFAWLFIVTYWREEGEGVVE